MQMNNWLVSTALGLGLLGSPQALAATTITWADLSKETVTQQSGCVSDYYLHSCGFCEATPFHYRDAANASGCNFNDYRDDLDDKCWTCDRASFPVSKRVPLPDGDLIDVTIEHGVEFRLESASNVTWWKQVAIVGGGEYWSVWNENGNAWCNYPYASTAGCNTNSQWVHIVTAPGTRFVFSKSKGIFGVHTEMYNLYNLAERLSGGDRVTFRWVKD
jgi:hypothetical protein